MKWNLRLGPRRSRFGGKNWQDMHKEIVAVHLELKVRLSLEVGNRTLVETHELEQPFSADIEHRTFIDDTSGYVIIIWDHTPRKHGESEFAAISEAHGWTSDKIYQSAEEAHKHILEELERARDYWAYMDSIVPYVDKNGSHWLPFLPSVDETGGPQRRPF